jgi:hypothetical protein
MNENEIEQFTKSFEDFMKHAEVQELYHEGQTLARKYAKDFFEKKASDLNVSVDYYLMEFV